MTDAESDIMRQFRRYLVEEGQMLFLHAGGSRKHPAGFHRAIESLVRDGLLIRERHQNAYSLTQLGYQASRSASGGRSAD